MSRLVIIDTMGVVHRAFHAMPKFTRAGDGRSVGAIGGFWQIVHKTLKLTNAVGDDLIAFASDHPGPTFRHGLCPTYKANRPEKPSDLSAQIGDILGTIDTSGIDLLQVPGFEADDVMATVAAARHADGKRTIIVSADMDMMQMMPFATLFGWVHEERINEHGKPFKIFVQRELTLDDCRTRLGCLPIHVPTALALIGDATDNVIGVEGVGEKTAARLIEAYGGLEAIYAAVPAMQNESLKDKLIRGETAALLALELVTLRTDVPAVPSIWSTVDDIDWGRLAEELREFGLVSAPDQIEPVL